MKSSSKESAEKCWNPPRAILTLAEQMWISRLQRLKETKRERNSLAPAIKSYRLSLLMGLHVQLHHRLTHAQPHHMNVKHV